MFNKRSLFRINICGFKKKTPQQLNFHVIYLLVFHLKRITYTFNMLVSPSIVIIIRGPICIKKNLSTKIRKRRSASVSGGAVGQDRLVGFVRMGFGLLDVLVAILGVDAVSVRAVARSVDAPLDHVVGGVLQVRCPTDAAEELYELRRPAVVHGQLGRPVVPGEGVVVVVPALSKSPHAHPLVLPRHDVPRTKFKLDDIQWIFLIIYNF